MTISLAVASAVRVTINGTPILPIVGGGGSGDLLSTNNLSDVANAATSRTNLGLSIGTNVQAYSALLGDIAGAAWAQGDLLYHNGTNLTRLAAGTSGRFLKTLGAGANPTWDIIAGGGDLLSTNNLSELTNFGTARTNLGLAIGANVQAWDATLDAFAAYNTNGILVQTAANTFTGRTLTAPAAGITVTDGNGVAGNPTLVLADDLAALEGLASVGIARRTGASTWSVGTLSETLDTVGSAAQGDILYRNATDWVRLAAGTSGQFLKTFGAASNPAWATLAGGGDMLASNNLSDLVSASTSFSNIKQAASATATGVVELATEAEASARTDTTRALTPAINPLPRSYLAGLSISNDVTDPTNDINIAVGECRDSTNATNIILTGALIKRLDAAFSVGTNQGGLDTGSIADTTYHGWLIKRSDTGVVDVLLSTSATAPTMPANYDYKRRIGSIMRVSAAIVPFLQDGDDFWRSVPVEDVNSTNPGTAAVTRTLSVPLGVRVIAKILAILRDGSNQLYGFFSSLDAADTTPSPSVYNAMSFSATAVNTGATLNIRTNTSAQIRSRINASGAADIVFISTIGWTDKRGRDD